MASGKEYLSFILDRLGALPGITYRPMMGEYLLYYRGVLVGGIYDDRLLLKPVKKAAALMPDAELQTPYDGAKPMLAPDNVDDGELLAEVIRAVYDELSSGRAGKEG